MKRYIAVSFALLACGGCLIGCASTGTEDEKQASFARWMDGLRDARANGQVSFESAGSPLALHLDNSFVIGPRQTTFRFSGSVDFREAGPPAPASTGP